MIDTFNAVAGRRAEFEGPDAFEANDFLDMALGLFGDLAWLGKVVEPLEAFQAHQGGMLQRFATGDRLRPLDLLT